MFSVGYDNISNTELYKALNTNISELACGTNTVTYILETIVPNFADMLHTYVYVENGNGNENDSTSNNNIINNYDNNDNNDNNSNNNNNGEYNDTINMLIYGINIIMYVYMIVRNVKWINYSILGCLSLKK